jgi:TRAP-type uncharacterized transport system substrate-binding protein
MRIILSILFVFINFLSAIELGTIATASKSGMYYKLGQDISGLLKEYNINLTTINTAGSYENMDILNGNYIENKNTFFAIVQKDTISYYNYLQYTNNDVSILNKIPAVLSLGIEQIHLIALEDSEFDFERRKTYKVYCGEKESGSCITARYIEKAYDFKFIYINSKKENMFKKLEDGMVDMIISVAEAPAKSFENLEGVKLLDLPTNFVMEDMYIHSDITKENYSWMDEDIHAFAVSKVLVTNLSDKKYEPVIENLVKILILNKKYLAKKYGEHWDRVDFSYTNFKKISKAAKRVIHATTK